MNSVQTLMLIGALGGVLTRYGNTLHVEAPSGAMPPPLLDAIRANKAQLLAVVSARPTGRTSNRKEVFD